MLAGMMCGGCVGSVKRILEGHGSVTSASVNLATETALVRVLYSAARGGAASNAQQSLSGGGAAVAGNGSGGSGDGGGGAVQQLGGDLAQVRLVSIFL